MTATTTSVPCGSAADNGSRRPTAGSPWRVRLVEVSAASAAAGRWVDVLERPGGATSSCVQHHGTRAEACACGRLRARATGGAPRRVLLGRGRVGTVRT